MQGKRRGGPTVGAARALAPAIAIASVFVLARCGGARSAPASSAAGPAGAPSALRSNVTRADYAGSAACAPCHPDAVASWERSAMHRMTRDLPGAEVRAPFDGAALRFKGDRVVLDRRGELRLVRVEPAGAPATTYRVTRVIGGRTREDFAGIAVGPDGRDRGDEVVLPVSFVLAGAGGSPGYLRYKGYSVMVHERSALRA